MDYNKILFECIADLMEEKYDLINIEYSEDKLSSIIRGKDGEFEEHFYIYPKKDEIELIIDQIYPVDKSLENTFGKDLLKLYVGVSIPWNCEIEDKNYSDIFRNENISFWINCGMETVGYPKDSPVESCKDIAQEGKYSAFNSLREGSWEEGTSHLDGIISMLEFQSHENKIRDFYQVKSLDCKVSERRRVQNREKWNCNIVYKDKNGDFFSESLNTAEIDFGEGMDVSFDEVLSEGKDSLRVNFKQNVRCAKNDDFRSNLKCIHFEE